jgi:hypothetical protein
MKKHILILAFLLICLYSKSQNNLVGNPGFETNPGAFNTGSSWGNYSSMQSASEWGGVPNWGTVDKTALNLTNEIGSPDLRKEYNFTTGLDNYFGLTLDREYIVQTFPIPMVANHIYYIQFDGQSPANKTPFAFGGLHFNTRKPRQREANLIKRSGFFQPNIGFPNADYADNQWHTVKAYWQAKDNFKYMTLGEIKENAPVACELAWDNFIIIDVGPGPCSAANWIQNLTFQNINGIVYSSQNLTASGNNVGAPAPNVAGDVHITSTAAVTFKSATEVALMPGFHADASSTFDAIIAPCSDAPCIVPSAYIGLDGQDICSQAGQTVQLGGPAGGNETYQWTVTDVNGNSINILSSTTISNPLLTVPSGSGFFDITEVATSGCDGTTNTSHNTIYYDNSPVTTPVVSVSTNNIVLTSSNLYPSFTIQGNEHTESVEVMLEDATGNIVDSWTIDNFPTYASNSYQYVFTDNVNTLVLCSSYTYHIQSQNICSDNISADQVVTVGPPSSITITNAPNVFSPNNDGINDNYCWGTVGAIAYNIFVKDRSGATVYTGSGAITNNNPCVWDGRCNSSCGTEGTDGIVCNGTYFFVLNFIGCNATVNTQASDVTVLGSCNGNRLINPNDSLPADTSLYTTKASLLTNKLGINIKLGIFPNPTTGLVNLNLTAQNAGNLLVNITDMSSNQVLLTSFNANEGDNNFKVDLSALNAGVYFIHVTDENGVPIKNDRLILMQQ